MKHLRHLKWLLLAVFLLTGFSLQIHSQEVDDLQEYLDKLAAEQPVQRAQTRGNDDKVVIPVGLTEVDLSKFSSYKNRTKELTIKASVKFINGVITATSDFSGGTGLLKIYDGATVILDETSGVDASAASMTICVQAVGIYGGSTLYQNGDIIAAGGEDGIAVFLSSSVDSYYYISGQLVGQISNSYGGKVVGVKDLATYVKELQARMETFGNDVNALQGRVVAIKQKLAELTTGTEFFMRKASSDYNNSLSVFNSHLAVSQTYIEGLINDFNALVTNLSVSTMEEAAAVDKSLKALEDKLPTADNDMTTNENELKDLVAAYEVLDVNFPEANQSYNLVPNTGVSRNDIQMGYKSNRGFVLTSAGMMFFEQVSGADFLLHNQDGNYVVVTENSSRLKAGTKAEATVWTGINLGNGMFCFYNKDTKQYLTCSGKVVNAEMMIGSKMDWKVTESDLDDLQAFLNLLAEEDEVENTGGGSGLTENDILEIEIPETDPDNNTNTWLFPRVPYIIKVGGKPWNIPNPEPGKKRPTNWHPVHIPTGSHVVIDDVTFVDVVGGGHVIYVEGILEININVIVNIMNWDWFIHVGPKGKVIWRPGKGAGSDWTPPRIKVDKGGTVEVVDGGHIGYVENTGTINHVGGTIEHVVNHTTYIFSGGLINFMDNYGTVTHSDGDVWKVYNQEGSTYTMTGGKIVNTVVNTTETIFYNLGTFYFKGGLLGGYGSRLIYHGPKGVLWLDGGLFDFTHIVDYFIEAHNFFYIRGDYEIPLPFLLKPSVTIRVLYKWIYKWKIIFIDGKPTPRYPLFIGDGDFRISLDYIKYIDLDWLFPNKRWRWYYKDTDNSLEVRDEEVQDEDDLQAYLDWLAQNQDGEAVSTEEEPQELDLNDRKIVITKEVIVPVGSHVYFKNGQFVPKSTWTTERVFYIPSGSSMKLVDVVIDWSSSVHYYVNSTVVQRYIFYIDGHIYLGSGCHIKGWLDSTQQPTDEFIPGAAFRFAPESRIYLNGGRFDNVIFRLNTIVNLYVSANITNNINVYVPSSCIVNNFRIAIPWNGYTITPADLSRIILYGLKGWCTKLDEARYVILSEAEAVSVRSAGQKILYCNKNLDFTDVYGLKAYIVTGYDKVSGKIYLTRVKNVPANTALLLMGDEGEHDIPIVASSNAIYKNMLVGVNEDTYIYRDGGENVTNYYLSVVNGVVGFYLAKEDGTGTKVSAGGGYLPLPTTIDAAGTAGSTEDIKMNKYGMLCYYSDQSLDFSGETDLKAYTATGYDKKGIIRLTRVKQVPAETAMLLLAPAEAKTYTVPTASLQQIHANMFVGTLEGTTICRLTEDNNYVNYYMSVVNGEAGFYWAAENGTSGTKIGAKRGWLPVPKEMTSLAATSRGENPGVLSMSLTDDVIVLSVFGSGDDDATGISRIAAEAGNDTWYNLSGQRIDKPTRKGLYIKNGIKVIVK